MIAPLRPPWLCHFLFTASLLLAALARAQVTTAPTEGLRENDPRVHALTNARIVTAPGKTIEKGTVVLRDGVIVEVGANVKLPADARVWDLTGKTIYPGFIDAYSRVGIAGDIATGAASPGNERPGRSRGEAEGNSARAGQGNACLESEA